MADGWMDNTQISQGTKPLNLHPLPCSNLLDRASLIRIFLLLQLLNPQGLLCQPIHSLNHHRLLPTLDCSVRLKHESTFSPPFKSSWVCIPLHLHSKSFTQGEFFTAEWVSNLFQYLCLVIATTVTQVSMPILFRTPVRLWQPHRDSEPISYELRRCISLHFFFLVVFFLPPLPSSQLIFVQPGINTTFLPYTAHAATGCLLVPQPSCVESKEREPTEALTACPFPVRGNPRAQWPPSQSKQLLYLIRTPKAQQPNLKRKHN